eukprot:PhM_4_TR2824/c0_g1_i1/m.265
MTAPCANLIVIIAFLLVTASSPALAVGWNVVEDKHFDCAWSSDVEGCAKKMSEKASPRSSEMTVFRDEYLDPKSKRTEVLSDGNSDEVANKVNKLGVAVLPAFSSASMCKDAALHVRAQAIQNPHEWHHDQRIDVAEHNDTTLYLAQATLGRMRPLFNRLFGSTQKAKVEAFASVTLLPEYNAGDVFTQQKPSSDGKVLTVYIMLEDVALKASPLNVWPRTHTASFTQGTPTSYQTSLHTDVVKPFRAGLQTSGSVVVVNGKVLQKFPANEDHRIHRSLYITMRSEDTPETALADALSADVHPSIKGKTLEDFITFVPDSKPKPKIRKDALSREEVIDVEIEQGYYKYRHEDL